jgi:small subunit ribosomal protein S6e
MAKLKLIISDPKEGKSQTVELEGSKISSLVGLRIGEIIDGATAGLAGKKLKICGGTDQDGFPMREDIHGGVKTKVLISNGTGFRARLKGERRRKTVRGNTITAETAQLNLKIVEGEK